MVTMSVRRQIVNINRNITTSKVFCYYFVHIVILIVIQMDFVLLANVLLLLI